MYLDSYKKLLKIKFLVFLFVKWLRFCLTRFELHCIRCLFLQIKNANESSFDENKNEASHIDIAKKKKSILNIFSHLKWILSLYYSL